MTDSDLIIISDKKELPKPKSFIIQLIGQTKIESHLMQTIGDVIKAFTEAEKEKLDYVYLTEWQENMPDGSDHTFVVRLKVHSDYLAIYDAMSDYIIEQRNKHIEAQRLAAARQGAMQVDPRIFGRPKR